MTNRKKFSLFNFLILGLVFLENISHAFASMSLSKMRPPVTPENTFHFEFGDNEVTYLRNQTVIAAAGCELETTVYSSHEIFTSRQLCNTAGIQRKLIDEQVAANKYIGPSVEAGRINLSQPTTPDDELPVLAVDFNTVPGLYQRVYDQKQSLTPSAQAQVVPTTDPTATTQKATTQKAAEPTMVTSTDTTSSSSSVSGSQDECEMFISKREYTTQGPINRIEKDKKEYITDKGTHIKCVPTKLECVTSFEESRGDTIGYGYRRFKASPNVSSMLTVFNDHSEVMIDCKTKKKV